MAVLAKPCNKAFVVSSEHKEKFIYKAKEARSFAKLMERTSNITAKVSFRMLTENSQLI